MIRNDLVSPVVKWVGGKRQLLSVIEPLLPEHFSSYCEPFVGGGAVFFSIQPLSAIINDINTDLITVYQVIQNQVDELIDSLKTHQNNSEYFYQIRDLDRNVSYERMDPVEKASRLIYLNKTCFNGLFRVNSAGEFNSPFGRYKNPNIVNENVLRAVSDYFNESEISFHSEDFAETLNRVPESGFVYLDPPYDPVSLTANFTGYARNGFGRSEQIRLKESCDMLTTRGVKFMLSNSATDFIKELYNGYEIIPVRAKRSVNSNAKKRGEVEEVIVRNYGDADEK